MPHDFAAQRAETVAAFDDMQDKHGLPEVADVDYFFVPTTSDCNWQPLAQALSREGYACTFHDAEGDTPAYLTATLPEQIISATGIWIGEELATRAALEHGFAPDGWGLES
jgi:hypothetical protein